jgi:hypothetical protein
LDLLIFVSHMVMETNSLLISYMIPNLVYKVSALGVVHSFVRETLNKSEVELREPVLPAKVSLMEYSENFAHRPPP